MRKSRAEEDRADRGCAWKKIARRSISSTAIPRAEAEEGLMSDPAYG